jgi:hypothetical protein
MHFSAIPNKNILVIFKSHGMFTKIFPNAVIFGLNDESANGGAIVNAPVA